MTDYFVDRDQNQLPLPSDRQKVEIGLANWLERAHGVNPALGVSAEQIAGDPGGMRLLEALFGNSPFLTHCIGIDPAFSVDLLRQGPDATFERLCRDMDVSVAAAANMDAVGRALRIAKRRAALTIALGDITGDWDLSRVTGALSLIAERTLSLASKRLLSEAAQRGKLTLPNPDDPAEGSGLVILGMGKLGARELNYSSDIDLIVLFDSELIQTDDPSGLQQTFVRLTRNLVKAMDERTADGYVFRTDLRLRPDPGSTPVAISVLAAETYYESIGQNWERAAMIKARPVAGDMLAGAEFLQRLRPFIWRKNLDFAAIQDVHSIKRQINAHRGGGEIAVHGHNVKLGRGGIREIEFFAQTQQLIWGGRMDHLRCQRTDDALNTLAQAERISQSAADQLIESYGYLRKLEHRLQMIDDAQTHTLPTTDEGLDHVARFMGYSDTEPFIDEFLRHLRQVEHHYADLFEDAPSLSGGTEASGNLVFTGSESDPDTLNTIAKFGFTNPKGVDATIRGWHHGRYRAMRSNRSRQMLTELVPTLLHSLGKMAAPDPAFMKFDEFISRLPSGVQLFSMFYSNPHLLGLVAELMGGAPRLADILSRNPSLLESVLSPDFFDPQPDPRDLCQELVRLLEHCDGFEGILDATRRWTNDRKFQIGVQTLRSIIDAETASGYYSDVADTVISQLLGAVVDEFSKNHGTIAGSNLAVIAMGKLGSREMTPSSDLDLVFIYDTPDATTSDGKRPLAASQYYARLSQRLINAITAPTSEGVLYEVDMRLRPSGNAGPIASSVESFVKYHAESSWTWESMALTKARVISGTPEFSNKVSHLVRDVLTAQRDADQLLHDVASMRQRLDKEHHSNFGWEVKYRRGGLIDIEFIAQYLVLRHAAQTPEILHVTTLTGLARLSECGWLSPAATSELTSALRFWHTIQGLLRLTIEGYFSPDREGEISVGLQEILMTCTGAETFADITAKMETTADTVMALYREIIGDPVSERPPQRTQ